MLGLLVSLFHGFSNKLHYMRYNDFLSPRSLCASKIHI